MIDIEIMQDASEIIHYDSPEIPFAIQKRLLSSYSNMRALCHWHQDLELISILDGEMRYDVNGKKIHLRKGDHILVNSHQLHFGYDYNQAECDFVCILFHPDLLKSNPFMYQNYVSPIINNPSIEYLLFKAGSKDSELILEIHNHLRQIFDNIKTAYEYSIVGQFYQLWSIIYNYCDQGLLSTFVTEDSDITLQKKMVSYVYQHYMEDIVLEDIAASANISRSKCCKIFKKFLKESPVSFLNSFRLETSRNLLKNTDYSITQIAISCGYSHLSYFSQIFLKKYGCTPNEYRKSQKNKI